MSGLISSRAGGEGGRHYAPMPRDSHSAVQAVPAYDESGPKLRKTRLAFPVGLAIALASIVALYAFHPPVFATVDDARLLYIYAGYATGEPTGTFLFSNALWGGFLAHLYTVLPEVNWYLLSHVLAWVIGLSILGGTLLRLSFRSGASLGMCLVVLGCIIVVMFSNAALILHFEVTGAILGAAAAVLMLLVDDCESTPAWLACMLGSVALLTLCLMHNKNVFYSCGVFVGIAWLYQSARTLTDARHPRRWVCLGFIMAFPIVMGAIYLLAMHANTAIRGDAWTDYLVYNPYRVSYSDYAHISYDDDPALFLSIGWSREFYLLTLHKYFIDERFSLEALSSIVKPFDRTSSATGFSLRGIVSVLFSMLKSNRAARLQVLFGAGLCVAFLAQTIRKESSRKHTLLNLTVIATLLAGTALVTYLSWRGRLPLRAWEVVALPALSICLVTFYKMRSLPPRQQNSSPLLDRRQGFWPSVAAMMLGGVAIAVAGLLVSRQTYLYISQMQVQLRVRDVANQRFAAVERYAIEHPDQLYVFDAYIQNYNPLSSYPNEKPTNLITWGTSYAGTPIWNAQMARNGRTDVTSLSFADGSVHFVCSNQDDDTDVGLFISMLRRDYGLVVVDSEVVGEGEDGFTIYTFGYPEPLSSGHVSPEPIEGVPGPDGLDDEPSEGVWSEGYVYSPLEEEYWYYYEENWYAHQEVATEDASVQEASEDQGEPDDGDQQGSENQGSDNQNPDDQSDDQIDPETDDSQQGSEDQGGNQQGSGEDGSQQGTDGQDDGQQEEEQPGSENQDNEPSEEQQVNDGQVVGSIDDQAGSAAEGQDEEQQEDELLGLEEVDGT